MKKIVFLFVISAVLIGGFIERAYSTPIKPYTIQEIVTLRQNKFAVAGDLKVKFWQKEDDVEIKEYKVLGTSGDLPMPGPGKVDFGEQPGNYHTRVDKLHANSKPVADNGKHAVDLTWDDISIDKYEKVDIKFKWTLTEYNVKHKEVVWSNKDNHDDKEKAGAKVGVEVKNPVSNGSGDWIHKVRISNLDLPDETDPMSIVIRDLKFWAIDDNNYIDIITLENWSTWSATFDDVLLNPGQFFEFDAVSTVPNSRILGEYKGVDPITDEWWIQDRFDHTSVPESATVLLLGLGLIMTIGAIRKRNL